jgi:hypothetical protein
MLTSARARRPEGIFAPAFWAGAFFLPFVFCEPGFLEEPFLPLPERFFEDAIYFEALA